jgi:hypothetical protein
VTVNSLRSGSTDKGRVCLLLRRGGEADPLNAVAIQKVFPYSEGDGSTFHPPSSKHNLHKSPLKLGPSPSGW